MNTRELEIEYGLGHLPERTGIEVQLKSHKFELTGSMISPTTRQDDEYAGLSNASNVCQTFPRLVIRFAGAV